MINVMVKYDDLKMLDKLKNVLKCLYYSYRNYNTTNNYQFNDILNKFFERVIFIINRYTYISGTIDEYIKNIISRKSKIGYNLHNISKEFYRNLLTDITNEIELDKALNDNLTIITNSLICHLIQNSRTLQTNIDTNLINNTNCLLVELNNVINKIKININTIKK